MKRDDRAFDGALCAATETLMAEFIHWNDTQRDLERKGYPHNHWTDEDLAEERNIFRAIAERFVLEDVDAGYWQWFETPWAGIDANTGGKACIVDFIAAKDSGTITEILAFYVAGNLHGYFAVPLADLMGPKGVPVSCEMNCIQAAIDKVKGVPF